MFFGQVPHAVILSEDCEKKYLDKVRGDIAENKCLVLVCDQNSFVQSKMVLVWPNWFGLDLNDLVMTKMKWSLSKWIGQVQIVIFYKNESHLDMTNSFWS